MGWEQPVPDVPTVTWTRAAAEKSPWPVCHSECSAHLHHVFACKVLFRFVTSDDLITVSESSFLSESHLSELPDLKGTQSKTHLFYQCMKILGN